MAFSVRKALIGSILLLGIVVCIEAVAVASIPLLVPDITARLQRIGAQAESPPPPSTIENADAPWLRPITLQDDFAQATARWDQSYVDVTPEHHLALHIGQPQSEVYSLFLGDGSASFGSIQDVDMTFDVTQVSGADDANVGVRFRQYTTDSYLYIRINTRGYWSVVRSTFGDESLLHDWQFSRHIIPGIGATNTIRVRAIGSQIDVFINDINVYQFVDYAPAAGQLTIGAETTLGSECEFHVDNVDLIIDAQRFRTTFMPQEPELFSVGGAFVADNTYHLVVASGVSMWQTPLPRKGSQVADFQMAVTGRIHAGDTSAVVYGVVFGDTGDFTHTMVLLSGTGVIQVVQTDASGNNTAYIEPVQLEAVRTGLDVDNRIELLLIDGLLSIRINDIDVGSVNIGTSPRGNVGMMVICGEQSAEVIFDDFELREIAQ